MQSLSRIGDFSIGSEDGTRSFKQFRYKVDLSQKPDTSSGAIGYSLNFFVKSGGGIRLSDLPVQIQQTTGKENTSFSDESFHELGHSFYHITDIILYVVSCPAKESIYHGGQLLFQQLTVSEAHLVSGSIYHYDIELPAIIRGGKQLAIRHLLF